MIDKKLVGKVALGGTADREVEEDRRLLHAESPVQLRLHDENAFVEHVAAAIEDRGGEDIEAGWRWALKIEEDGAAGEMIADMFGHIFADGFKKRMPRCDPFERGIL